MPVYKVQCSCGYSAKQYLTKDVSSVIIPCPHCMKGVTARKIKTKGFTEAEADGVVGYLEDDKKTSRR